MNMSVPRQTIERMEDRVKDLENALTDAYVMLDRFAGDMTTEAYEEVEAILKNALEDNFAAESRIRTLEDKVKQLRSALHRIESAANEQKAEADPDPDEIWLMARKALKGGDAHE